MKLTANRILAQMRARRCCELPVASKKESIIEMVPITMVESTIRGVENSQDRSELMASPRSWQ
jgi:hypothetical protein